MRMTCFESVPLIALSLMITMGGNQCVHAADFLDIITEFFTSLFGSTKCSATGTIRVIGPLHLQNKSLVIPQTTGWHELKNPSSPIYADITAAVKAVIAAFYIATGFAKPTVTINAYRPSDEDVKISPAVTNIDYTIKFDMKNVSFLSDYVIVANKTVKWSLALFQEIVNQSTVELRVNRVGEDSTGPFISPFSWPQVDAHEIKSFNTGVTHHHKRSYSSTASALIIVALLVAYNIRFDPFVISLLDTHSL